MENDVLDFFLLQVGDVNELEFLLLYIENSKWVLSVFVK